MDFDENFIQRGHFDVSATLRLLHALPDDVWSDTVAKVAAVHRHSRGVFLKNDIKTEHCFGTVHPHYETFKSALAPILETVRAQVGDGYFVRLQFSRHSPGYGFDPHHDRFSYTLVHSRRMHMAIETNDQVWFEVGGERKHLGVGELWEINNCRIHAGNNGGTTPRTHLIIDFAIPIRTPLERARYLCNLQFTSDRAGWFLCRPALQEEREPGTRTEDVAELQLAARVGEIRPGLIVGLNHVLRDHATGAVLTEDLSDEPVAYAHGAGQLPLAFETALEGRKVGESVSMHIPAECAFGRMDSNLRISVHETVIPTAREHLPVFGFALRDCPIMAFATSSGGIASLDANHPYAGYGLDCEFMVCYVRSPDPDEQLHAIFHGPTLSRGEVMYSAMQQLASSSDFDPHWQSWVRKSGIYRVH